MHKLSFQILYGLGAALALTQPARAGGVRDIALTSIPLHFRTLDFPGGENKNPGPNRGYVSLQSWIGWEGADGGLWVVNHQDSTPEWKVLRDSRFNYYGVPLPYQAPVGAKFAVVQFNLSANFAQRLPKAYLDDVEFVEVP